MSEGNRTPTRQFVEIGDAHVSAESASDVEDNLQSQLLERKLSSSEVDRINAIYAPLATQLETLIQSLRELSKEVPTDRLKVTWHPNDQDRRVSVPTPSMTTSTAILTTMLIHGHIKKISNTIKRYPKEDPMPFGSLMVNYLQGNEMIEWITLGILLLYFVKSYDSDSCDRYTFVFVWKKMLISDPVFQIALGFRKHCTLSEQLGTGERCFNVAMLSINSKCVLKIL